MSGGGAGAPPAERLRGRRVFVTGGASGIGRASALRLAAEGASVAVLDKRREPAESAVDEIVKQGGRGLALACDVGVEREVAACVERAAQAFGGLDGVFANAGTAGRGWIHELPLEEWEAVLRVNLTGVFLTAKHTLPHLLEAGGGAVVTTGSVASVVVAAGGSAASYAASKGGVLQLTRQIAVDYGAGGIRANCLCPGAVRTRIAPHSHEDNEARGAPPAEPLPRSRFAPPLARAAAPEELAGAVAFLLSDDASFITGTAFFVDGGYTAI